MEQLKKGRVKVEIRIIDTKKLLNLCWLNDIKVYRVQSIDISTVRLVINYLDYEAVANIVKTLGGTIEALEGKGTIFILGKIKKRYSLTIAAIIFLAVLYYLSTYIWSIDIYTGKNIAPFEVRKQLEEIGISPGMKKDAIDVAEVEKQLESINSEVLWLRVRIEGSSLKVTINEKINPPSEESGEYGNLVATEQGEIKRVYTFSGRSKVEKNQIVKPGDVVIEGVDGNEASQYVVPPKGIVVANVFYEKEIEVKTAGTTLVRSGKKDSDIYLSIFGKKIYLKKAIKGFENYDRIEKSGKLFNEVVYYERIEKNIELSEEEATNNAINTLEKSLIKDLKREAKIVDKIVTKEKNSEEALRLKVVFVVEQNIASDNPVSY